MSENQKSTFKRKEKNQYSNAIDKDNLQGLPSDEGSGDDINPMGSLDDSSEEEDDDDEEEQRRVAEGFIVDDEEEGEGGDGDGQNHERRKKKKHKRKRRIQEPEEGLDEDDLDLLEENIGMSRDKGPKFKRLKRRDEQHHPEGLEAIFDQDQGQDESLQQYDEMDDFIEQDESDDEQVERSVRPHGPRSSRPLVAGINPDQWDEIYEIFGDGADYADALEDDQGDKSLEKQTQLKDIFEPSEIIDRFLTEDDDIIRMRDIPERIQILHSGSSDGKLDDILITEESKWIVTILLKSRQLEDNLLEPFTKAVNTVLKYLSQDFFEVPFIWAHRRDYIIHVDNTNQVIDLLNRDDLWTIQDLDFRFRSFIERRKAVRSTYERLQLSDDYFEECFQFAEDIDDISSLTEYIAYFYSKEIRESNAHKENKYKKAIRSNIYERTRNTNIMNFIKDFGISARQFAVNVHDGTRRHFTEDPDLSPNDYAEKFTLIESEFGNSDAVLFASHNIISHSLGVDPHLRKEIRFIFQNQGRINVIPTEKGRTEILEIHPYNEFKYLHMKPVSAFHNTVQILQILDAERQGLVTVNIHLEDEERIFRGFRDLYISDAVSAIAQEWNEERTKVLKLTLNKHLYPYGSRWIKEKLRQEAEDWLATKCGNSLEQRIDMTPYKPKDLDRGNVPRILAFSWGHGDPRKDAVMAVYLDENGRVLDQTKFNDLRDEKDRNDLVELVDRQRPDVIAIAGFSVATHFCRQQIKGILDSATTSEPLDIDVVYVNDEVARIYHTSHRGLEEFGDLPPIARYCVALGRYMQSPLYEYVALGRDILAISYDPWQKFLPEEKLYNHLERALINIVNVVGVNINEALQKQYRGNVLPFVCGLGPRKVTSIAKRINGVGGNIASRSELITKGIVTPKVFVNCASFIRITQDDVIISQRDDTEPDVLDDTRIHPEDYDLARKMAADALELDEEDLQDYQNKSDVVKQLMKDEGVGLDQLILEDYAFELERVTHQQKRITLHTIKQELQAPYSDHRKEFQFLTTMEVFTMLTGETSQTLQPGFIVPATIRNVKQSAAYARLDSGIEGEIQYENVSDDPTFSNVSDMLEPGLTVKARVIELDYENFRCQLSTRKSDVTSGDSEERKVQPDSYYDNEASQRDQDIIIQTKKKSEVKPVRMIQHPLFKPFNSKQAEIYLENLQRGDVVIRPSSKGNDHLVLTWKVDDGVYQHIDVLELDKDNEFSLGRVLRVGGKFTYSDLDELIVSHIQAMARKVDEMLNHDKFKRGSKKDLEEFLNNALLANPNRAAYAFGIDIEHPGYFHLAYKTGPKDPIIYWNVKVIPGGFELRQTVYADMPNLCNGFKIRMTTLQAQKRKAQEQQKSRSDYQDYNSNTNGGSWRQQQQQQSQPLSSGSGNGWDSRY